MRPGYFISNALRVILTLLLISLQNSIKTLLNLTQRCANVGNRSGDIFLKGNSLSIVFLISRYLGSLPTLAAEQIHNAGLLVETLELALELGIFKDLVNEVRIQPAAGILFIRECRPLSNLIRWQKATSKLALGELPASSNSSFPGAKIAFWNGVLGGVSSDDMLSVCGRGQHCLDLAIAKAGWLPLL